MRRGQSPSSSSHISCPDLRYGYRGICPDKPYLGDEFDAARLSVFGLGRSSQLIQAWCTAKEFLKIFDNEGYTYQVTKLLLGFGSGPEQGRGGWRLANPCKRDSS